MKCCFFISLLLLWIANFAVAEDVILGISAAEHKEGQFRDRDYSVIVPGGMCIARFYADGPFECSFRDSKRGYCDFSVPFNRIGSVSVDFNFTVTGNMGNSQSGVYFSEDVSKSKTINYYIIEDLKIETSMESTLFDFGQKLGEFTTNGSVYTIYKNEKTTINNYRNTQYTTVDVRSVRKTSRKSGIVNVSAHVQQWEKLGFEIGTITNVKIYTDNYPTAGQTRLNGGIHVTRFDGSICSLKITSKNYNCCSSTCKTRYRDADGNWGTENGEWCGCGNPGDVNPNCPYQIIALGYDCCWEKCEVISVDKYGNWGIENGQWCGCYN